MRTVAALYVETDGCYFGLPGVDPWDQARDARLYAGPHPIVAHPPCQRWGKLWAGQPLFIKRTGIRKIKGDDGGCFKAALDAVRAFGGVIEHPDQSHAWAHFGLNKPPRRGGWIAADMIGGWTCCVEQGRYGHYARKPTWLYAYGVVLPELDWGIGESRLDPAIIERMGLARAKRLGEVGGRGGGKDSSPRIGTPEPFRNLLLSMARSVVCPVDRVNIIDKALDSGNRGIIRQSDERTALAAGGFAQPDLLVGDVQFGSTPRAIERDADVVEFSGHAVTIPHQRHCDDCDFTTAETDVMICPDRACGGLVG